MKLSHLTAAQMKKREELYEPRGFITEPSDSELLIAVTLAVAIQKELVAASVISDHRLDGNDIVDVNWGDVLEWIADAEKDEDDLRILRSIKLTNAQIELLDDYADVIANVSKGVTKTSASKFGNRYETTAQKREREARAREIKAEREAAEARGEEYTEPDDAQEESIAVNGVIVSVCDTCDELAYVPQNFTAKNCNFSVGCTGTLMKPPKTERMYGVKKREDVRRLASNAFEKETTALNAVEDAVARNASDAVLKPLRAERDKTAKAAKVHHRNIVRVDREDRIERNRSENGSYNR